MNIIAEIGQAHDGSLGILHSYIDALADLDIDSIKFQMHIADAESSPQEPFRVPFSYEDKTRYDYWDRMSFSFEQWIGIKKHCEEKQLEFLCSPFSVKAVELLEKLNVSAYKLGSGCINNYLLVDQIVKTGKPIIISTGLCSDNELKNTINRMEIAPDKLTIMHCVSKYPSSYEQLNLNRINELKSLYPKHKIGYSDHSGSIFPCYAAAVAGAEVIEFHAVFDRRCFGPDSSSSLEIDEVKQLAIELKQIRKLFSAGKNNKDCQKEDYKQIFGYALAAKEDIMKGAIINMNMLESKKPLSAGMAAKEYETIIGKKVNKDIARNTFIQAEDLI